jgi:parallel beta-helix repeat protein
MNLSAPFFPPGRSNPKFRWASLLLLVITLTNPCYLTAADFFVAPNGSDSDAGTFDQPWASIQHAADTLSAGDSVFIRAGTYSERITPINSGSEDNEILYSAYNNKQVIIDGASLQVGEFEGLFHIFDRQYIRVTGLRVINVGPFGTSTGIQVEGSSQIVIEGNQTYNTASSGIFVWGSTDVTIDNNEVELASNLGADSLNECITLGETTGFIVSNNHVLHGNTIRGEGIDAKDGSSDGVIFGNHVHDIPYVGIYIES